MIRHVLVCLLWVWMLPGMSLSSLANDPVMVQQLHPGSDLWNAVRQREGSVESNAPIRTQVKGVESEVLINTGGETWRIFRMDVLIPIAAKVLGFLLLAILIFRLFKGRIPIEAGRSHRRIKRFTTLQRVVHWITAILFVGLAVSGIALLFGRYIIMPLFDDTSIGGGIMYYLKRLHDFSGPVFGVSLVVMIVVFMKGNFPSPKVDLLWFARAGGMLGGGHPQAGRYNAGEKSWYWLATIVGIAVVISGLVLDFPNFEQSRATMSYYHYIHAVAAVIIMAGSLGHIYMGTIAMEGAFETMHTGYCDANWAKEHHDLWYDEMVEAGQVEQLEPSKAVNEIPDRVERSANQSQSH